MKDHRALEITKVEGNELMLKAKEPEWSEDQSGEVRSKKRERPA